MILEPSQLSATIAPHIISPTAPDIAFHNWCTSVGIPISSSVQLATTPRSVAGRGVFAIEPLKRGEIIAAIPSAVVFHPENAAECFPGTARLISNAKKPAHAGFARKGRWISRLWAKMLRRDIGGISDDDIVGTKDTDLWQPELTQYAISALAEDHPWADWISQWRRDDPMHRLYVSGVASCDENAISATADELKSIMPQLSHLKLRASLAIRLGRMEGHRNIVGLSEDTSTSEMYSLVSSRAIELDGQTGLTGIIPFYDMINHSLHPNLHLDYDGEVFELFANRDIDAGEELFLTYTKLGDPMDKNNALWALVQWGIPTDERNIIAYAEEDED